MKHTFCGIYRRISTPPIKTVNQPFISFLLRITEKEFCCIQIGRKFDYLNQLNKLSPSGKGDILNKFEIWCTMALLRRNKQQYFIQSKQKRWLVLSNDWFLPNYANFFQLPLKVQLPLNFLEKSSPRYQKNCFHGTLWKWQWCNESSEATKQVKLTV